MTDVRAMISDMALNYRIENVNNNFVDVDSLDPVQF
jgi:hypothetical protein